MDGNSLEDFTRAMKPKLILCLALVLSGGLFGCATKPDEIDGLVADLSSSHGIWLNGFPPPSVDLRQSATFQQVVAEVFRKADFDPGRVTSYRILKTRRVQIADNYPESYIAVLADTNLGKKIVLMYYDQTGRYWWRRIYNVNSPDDRWY